MAREYRTATTRLDPGALLVCYTDGLVERRDRILDDGLAWLDGAGAANTRAMSLPTLCDKLVDDPFVPHPSPDDICVVALRVDGAVSSVAGHGPRRSTSAARSWRSVSSTPTGRVARSAASRPDARGDRCRGAVRALAAAIDDLERRGRPCRHRRRLRRPDDARRRARLAAQHPRVAGLPAAGAARRALRSAGVRRQRRQGARARRRLDRRRRRRVATTSRWSCRPASAAASCSTAGCSTATTATPATSATSSSSPTARRAAAARAAASRPRRRAPRSRASPARRPPRRRPRSRTRTGTLVGRAVASVANLLDLPLAVVSGSVALGYGEPFFAAAQAEIDARCRLDFSRGTRIVPGALGDDGPLDRRRRVACHSRLAKRLRDRVSPTLRAFGTRRRRRR